MLAKILTAAIAFLAAFFIVFPQEARACSCRARPTVLDSYESSELVVAAKLVSVEKIREKERQYDINYITSVKMIVEKVYKGQVKVGEELTFRQGGGADCIWTFDEEDIGDKYLFYLGPPTKGHPIFNEVAKDAKPMYYAVTCGRSRGLKSATDDLGYLDNLDKTRGRSRISGQLGNWYGEAPSFANIKIKFAGKSKTYETKTDKDGFYEIYDLPAGEYFVEPEPIKGWKINERMLEYSSGYEGRYGEKLATKNRVPIRLEDKRHAGLDLLYVYDTAIRGRVVSPTGKPMKDVSVMAVSTELKEGDYRGRSDYTDEKGEFTIDEIAPDNYILVVNDDGKIGSNTPFGILFYPGVSNYKEAGVIMVAPGKLVNDVAIQVPKAVELIEISGKFLYSDGKPVVNESVDFIPDETTRFDTSRAKSGADGSFVLKVPKGVSGKISGDIYVYAGKFKDCAKLEELIRASGKSYFDMKSDEIEVTGNESIFSVRLTLPFPYCVKSESEILK